MTQADYTVYIASSSVQRLYLSFMSIMREWRGYNHFIKGMKILSLQKGTITIGQIWAGELFEIENCYEVLV